MRRLLTACAALFAATLATGQDKSDGFIKISGLPCATLEGLPTMSVPGDVPRIGSSVAIGYSGPNHLLELGTNTMTRPFLILGFDRISVLLPTTLFPAQPAGCYATISHDLVVPMPADPVLGNFQQKFAISVPSDPRLIGFEFFAQWWVVHRRCDEDGYDHIPIWIGTSDTLAVRIGA